MIFICDDNALMEQVKSGDKKAFEKLVLLHRKSAIGFAYRLINDSYLPEDIVQESFAAIIGIILLVPIFVSEESKEIDEIAASKSMPAFKPYVVRTILTVISVLVLVIGFCTMLRYNSCTFPFVPYIFGTFISALFLGSIGMLASSLSGSTITGYMASIGYLIINMMTGNKYVGKFYIMSMKNNSFNEKYYLLFGGVVFIVLAIMIKVMKRKF